MGTKKLYRIEYDSQPYYVEACDFMGAIDTWKRHVAKEWGDEFEGTEEPESCALIHESHVIREAEAPTAI